MLNLNTKWSINKHEKNILSELIKARAEKEPEGFDIDVLLESIPRFEEVTTKMGLTICQISEVPYKNMHCFGIYPDGETMAKREALR